MFKRSLNGPDEGPGFTARPANSLRRIECVCGLLTVILLLPRAHIHTRARARAPCMAASCHVACFSFPQHKSLRPGFLKAYNLIICVSDVLMKNSGGAGGVNVQSEHT